MRRVDDRESNEHDRLHSARPVNQILIGRLVHVPGADRELDSHLGEGAERDQRDLEPVVELWPEVGSCAFCAPQPSEDAAIATAKSRGAEVTMESTFIWTRPPDKNSSLGRIEGGARARVAQVSCRRSDQGTVLSTFCTPFPVDHGLEGERLHDEHSPGGGVDSQPIFRDLLSRDRRSPEVSFA